MTVVTWSLPGSGGTSKVHILKRHRWRTQCEKDIPQGATLADYKGGGLDACPQCWKTLKEGR